MYEICYLIDAILIIFLMRKFEIGCDSILMKNGFEIERIMRNKGNA